MRINISILFVIISFQFCNGQEMELFSSEDPINLTIKWNINRFLNKNEKEAKRYSTVVIYNDTVGKRVKVKAEIEKRGNFRRNPENCSLPPISLHFNKKNTSSTIFDGYKKIKVVSRCDLQNEYLVAVKKELLCYKINELLNPYSYKTQAVNIEYIDRSGNLGPMFSFGFLIEPKKHMVKRIGDRECKDKAIPYSQFNQDALLRFFLFQHLIGNTDWMIQDNHNVKIVENDSVNGFIPVAYDMDLAYFCKAPYLSKVIGDKELPMAFGGIPIQGTIVQSVVNDIIDKRSQIELLISNSLLMNDQKQELLNMIDDFYQNLIDPEFIKMISK